MESEKPRKGESTVENGYKVAICLRTELLLYAELLYNRPKFTLEGHVGAMFYVDSGLPYMMSTVGSPKSRQKEQY